MRSERFDVMGRRKAANVRSFGLILLSFIVLTGTASAETKQCRLFDSRKERNACYEEQKRASKQPASPRAKMSEDIDQLKLENDRLTRRLRDICRGC